LCATQRLPSNGSALSLDELERVQEFIASSLQLVLLPLASFLEELSECRGGVVLISSAAVTSPTVGWPHYVTAKAAAEGIVNWAAPRYPGVHFLIVRPPRLLTGQMNTVADRVGSLPVEQVAAAVVRRLCATPAERVNVLDTFQAGNGSRPSTAVDFGYCKACIRRSTSSRSDAPGSIAR
jgi:hypothetical protein